NLLNTYSFPGNVRELRAILINAVSQHESKVMSMEVVSSIINRNVKENVVLEMKNDPYSNVFAGLDDLPPIREAEEQLILEALRRSEGIQSIAARMLGITRQTLSKKLRQYGQ
ncbi:MAG: hypothetical protein M0O94_05960, partial [Bacteroidales bacterium]|nr:hypothetical protein [Bacteroidales bacterium]